MRRESRRPHAQEAERPEHEREDQRADRDGANVRGVRNLADDGRIHDADQRARQVREHRGPGEREHRAVRQHWTSRGERAHRVAPAAMSTPYRTSYWRANAASSRLRRSSAVGVSSSTRVTMSSVPSATRGRKLSIA